MDDLQKSKIRSVSYWFVDGLPEIGTGSVITLMGVLFYILTQVPQGSAWVWIIGTGQPIIILGALFIASRIVRYFKERITFPRTGYVSYPKPKVDSRIKRGLLAAVVAASVSLLITLLSGKLEPRYVPLFIDTLSCLAIVTGGFNYGLKRFYVLGVVALLTGFVLYLLNLPQEINSALIFISFGLSFIISGVITLNHYLNTTEPVLPEELE